MKILYHHRTLGDGAEGIHIKEMVGAFRSMGHTVKVIGPIGEVSASASLKSQALEKLKRSMPSSLYEACEISYTGHAFLNLFCEILRFKPNFIYDRYITFNAGPVLAAKMLRVPVFLEVNAPLALERSIEPDERLVFRSIALCIEKWVCSNSTRTLVVSTPLKNYLESIGVPKGQCVVMPNGVDPVRFSPRSENPHLLSKLSIPKGDFVVGFTGVLRAWHGLDLLLTAVANMKKKGARISLLIVGDGPYRQEFEKVISAFGLERFVFVTGRIPHEQVPAYISLFDVAVSPKATFYSSPMKVIEYMALGKPVVVPRAPNFLDIIDDGANGITFEDGNVDNLEKALGLLFESPELCRRIGRKARAKVESRLNWRWNAEAACRLFRRERLPANGMDL